MGALERVSAMMRSLPGTWEIVKLYLIIRRRNHMDSSWQVFHAEQWHQRFVICVDVKCHPRQVI